MLARFIFINNNEYRKIVSFDRPWFMVYESKTLIHSRLFIRKFREKFASRKREVNWKGSKRNDWWSVDFDLSELKELRLKPGIWIHWFDLPTVIWYKSRNQRFRDSLQQENSLRNPAYDGLYPIPTLQEYIDGEKGVR